MGLSITVFKIAKDKTRNTSDSLADKLQNLIIRSLMLHSKSTVHTTHRPVFQATISALLAIHLQAFLIISRPAKLMFAEGSAGSFLCSICHKSNNTTFLVLEF
jgi:hypothetical protein